ncbi:MAG TPA: GWxTD domain-containing protein, partial [Gemmatimonadales bacterium]|nr:GWxTD domain-containing protein [Gemmatimonadales bacterium]
MQLDSRTLPRRARATRSVIALLSFLSGFSAGLLGQTPEQRREIDAFRDTLQSVTDTLALREREKRLLPFVRRARSDPAFHLSLGYLALRQGELGGASHLDEAASEFRLAASLAPQWPYAWLAVAYAEYTLGGRLGGSERRAMLARDAFSRATQAFARAVTLEPGFASRLEELARRAVRDGSLNKAGVIREALRRATSAPLRGARLLLALGRVQRELGDTAALGTLAAYLATHDNRALGLVELGRTQLLRGDWSGAAAYLAGAVDDDPVAGAEYRADLASIASDSDLAEFDRRRGPARAEFLRRFWTVRDRLELRREGERLAEHLRRLAVARREFLVVMPDSTERFDDRGRIYVRHGDPDDRASYVVPGIEPNESWRYRRGGAARADLVLHFVARQAPNDYRLVESVVDVSNARGIPAAGKSRNAAPASEGLRLAETTEQLFRSRSALAPRYRQMPPSRPDQLADFLTWERALGRRGIRVAASSDSYVLHFARDLDAWGALLVAGGSGARPMIQVVFAIPGYRIEPATGAAGVVYPVRVRFAALDSLGNLVASVDSTAWIELG